MPEQVLVVPQSVIEPILASQSQDSYGFFPWTTEWEDALFSATHWEFRLREVVETDPSWLQLITYAVLYTDQGIYSYQRGTKGSESRLHSQWSIGIGGHINPVDLAVGRHAYRAAFERELSEEVGLFPPIVDELWGVVYDPRTPVGRVHLGVVHGVKVDSVFVGARESALVEAEFRSWERLMEKKGDWESWSWLVLQSKKMK